MPNKRMDRDGENCRRFALAVLPARHPFVRFLTDTTHEETDYHLADRGLACITEAGNAAGRAPIKVQVGTKKVLLKHGQLGLEYFPDGPVSILQRPTHAGPMTETARPEFNHAMHLNGVPTGAILHSGSYERATRGRQS